MGSEDDHIFPHKLTEKAYYIIEENYNFFTPADAILEYVQICQFFELL